MPGGININNLEGAVKAFALAADQNNDLKIDEKEIKLFNQFINGANLRQDEGLKLEQSKVSVSNDPKDIKKAQKEEAKMYSAYFGKDEVDKVKADEGEANRRVINAFKELKGAKSPQMLNDAISGRPDMADYAGDAEGYKKALDNWADGVEAALKKSIVQTINDHTTDVGNTTNEHITDVGNDIKSNIEKFAEKLTEAIENGNARIIGEIGKAKDGIIKAVQTAEGHIVRVVVNQANRIVRVVEKEADLIHMHMDWNTGAIMDHTSQVGKIVMENSNRNHSITRTNSDINAQRVMNNSDYNHQQTRGIIKQEGFYDTISDQFNANMNRNGRIHTEGTVARLQKMFNDVRTSGNIDDETKSNLLIELNNYTRANEIFNDSELDQLENKINQQIKPRDTRSHIDRE